MENRTPLRVAVEIKPRATTALGMLESRGMKMLPRALVLLILAVSDADERPPNLQPAAGTEPLAWQSC